MKTLHIIDHFNIGGAQTIIKSIFDAQKDNKDIYCYSLRALLKTNKKVSHPNFFSCKSHSKFSLSTFFELKKIIKENNISVLHCHLRKGFLFGWLMKKLFFKNIKLIMHEHSCILGKSKLYKYFLKLIRKDADLFIAVSESVKKALIEKANIRPEKIVVLPNFADLSKFNFDNVDQANVAKIKSELALKGGELIIGFIGRLTPQKNCQALIRAIPLLNIDNFKVLIIGSGQMRRELTDLITSLNLTDKVIFLGHRGDIVDLLSIMDVCVLPSKWEGSPMIFYEAAAMGVPVVGSNVDGINEFIAHGKNGLLFEYNNLNDLTANITKLSTDKNLRGSIKLNLKNDLTKHSLKNYLKKLKQI
ncbi:glycosyltransferase family 4 protein [Patescibacteria group bacterium]|nr:glycosyltransferase family 4 protein [Patescibacteria group bacterium]MBU1682987.1 glycosyltransferase family 4 protein [Patescibacteria group bacterium]MBU1935036.1 glycosyltransferase family 4 protein [Patescibacteria group bacterium]